MRFGTVWSFPQSIVGYVLATLKDIAVITLVHLNKSYAKITGVTQKNRSRLKKDL